LQLAGIGLSNTEDNRRSLREFLFTTPDIEKHISGVVSGLSGCIQHSYYSYYPSCKPGHVFQILFEETLYQRSALAGDTTLTQILESKGIVPGIKVDVGVAPLPGSPQETFTQVGTLVLLSVTTYIMLFIFRK
jgi:fructose-bisphosphate aldolase class I